MYVSITHPIREHNVQKLLDKTTDSVIKNLESQ